jgi:hypothetical protein
MPSSQQDDNVHVGLYISIPVYFALLSGCAFWAHKKMERMDQ